MSAMSIEAEDVREGTIDLFTPGWYCIEHSAHVKDGRECAWCVHDLLGPAKFEEWAKNQTI
jgi:hypothetical protein